MGSTLIPEENLFLGFLPLNSYITARKDIKTGAKCPPDMEEAVRCLILIDSLERLGCTYQDLNGNREERKEE
jgi:hypothetical protein